MKKIFVLALLLLALCACTASGLGEGEGVVVQSACNIVQSGQYYLVYCYAQIHNSSDQVIALEQGVFDLLNGEDILATQQVTQLWPYFLNPGEDGYVFDIVSFEPDENGNPVIPQVQGISYQIEYMSVDQRFASYSLQSESSIVVDTDGSTSVVCRLTNPMQMDAYAPTVAVGLYTDSGAMIYADGTTLTNVGIPAGGTTLVRFTLDEAFVEQWNSYGVSPAQMQVNASFRRDED